MDKKVISKEEISRQLEIAERYRQLYGSLNEKYYTECYGCQQNEADTERLSGIAEKMGYKRTYDKSEASLILINTCAIREHAELKALSNAGQLKKLKESNPSLLIGICGCMVQEKHRREQILKSYPYIDFLLGTDMQHTLAETVEKARVSPRRICAVNEVSHDLLGNIAEDLPIKRELSYRAWVSIMYGCNNFCSYCIVPYVRGYERSRSEDKIIDEVKQLVAEGVKDITLLGQNVNSYKGDRGTSFPELLRQLCELDGDFRIRFMTSHPKDCSDELIEVCKHEKIARHFHLPFQSGNDRILGLMNRKYTKQQYLERALKIRSELPDFAVTTDVICGFPSETEAEFLDTVDVVEKVKFDMIYTFLYSPRVGTKAASMTPQIEHEEKVKRFNILNSAENIIAKENNERLVGTVQQVLCDTVGQDGSCSGRSSQNKIVSFKCGKAAAGLFYNIKITKAEAYALSGELEKQD